MSGRWAARFRSITAAGEAVDTVAAGPVADDGTLSTVSTVSSTERSDHGLIHLHSVNTVNTVTDDGNEIEADERDAIQNEESYATRQTIPQATMVAGLLSVSRGSVRR